MTGAMRLVVIGAAGRMGRTLVRVIAETHGALLTGALEHEGSLALGEDAGLLAGCGLSDQQKADYASVQRAGVSSAIYDKMVHEDPLSINDIISLSQAHVSDGVIVRYIRDHGTVYVMTSGDFEQLHQAGVSSSVIDFMARSGDPGYYPYGPGPGPYFYPPPIAIGIGFGGAGTGIRPGGAQNDRVEHF